MDLPVHRTYDPYLASFVLSQGAVLTGITRLKPKKTEFRFVADRQLHDLLRLYWSGEPLPLTPARLFKTLRYVKSLALAESR
jgi:hypothetical protein